MPNHVMHEMLLHGSVTDIRRFRERAFHSDEKGRPTLDFNAFIPMPEELDVEAGSRGRDAYELLEGDASRSHSVKKGETREEAIARLEKDDPEALELGKTYRSNIERYGFPHWYDWRCEKWGTKWNAYDVLIAPEDDDPKLVVASFTVFFSTAWSPPLPVFHAMSKAFPDLRFEVRALDEMLNFACEGAWCGGSGSLHDVDVHIALREWDWVPHEQDTLAPDGC